MTTIDGDLNIVLWFVLIIAVLILPALLMLWLGWITRDAPRPPGMGDAE